MEWQTKTSSSSWDFEVLQAGSGAVRKTQVSDQWGLQDDGALFPGFCTTQKGHFPTPSSSGTTAGSLDSSLSGFPGTSGNCSNGLLLGPCPSRDTGKVRNGWLFADKETNGLPRVASGLDPEDGGASKQHSRLRMVEKSGNARQFIANGQGVPENTPPKVDVTKESQVISNSNPVVKRISREETADHQGAPSRAGTMSPSPPPNKKHRNVAQGVQVPRCQVEGCRADLSAAKDYHRRHKVCAIHSKSPKVITSGIEQRFCQQCSRFHVLSEFDDAKRSCRRRLAGHNERRRKSSQDTTALSMASILQDDPRHLNAMLDRSYFMQHPMAIPLSIHDNVEARRAWSRVELEQQLAMACRAQLQNGDRLPYGAAERLMMILQAYKGSAAAMAMPSMKYTQAGSSCVGDIGLTLSSSQSPNHMLGGNIEAAAAAGLLDSGRALSLLSSQALPTSTTSSHQAALEKFIDHNTVSIQHHDNYPPITLQSGFSLADYSLNHQYKLLSALPSSPRSLGLSVGMSVAGVAEKEQQQRLSQKVLQNHAVENLGSNPVLAQLLQRPEFRNLGGSSPPDVKDSMELPSSDSEQNHHQQRFATSPLQASTASLSQHLQSLRGYELSSLFSAPPNTA